MIRTALLIIIVATAFSFIVTNMYTSALDSQIAIMQEAVQETEDSLAYYKYEYKHSTSGTRRHVGKALQKVVDQLWLHGYDYEIRQKELQDLREMRQQFADILW